MSPVDVSELLRPDLLAGISMLLTRPAAPGEARGGFASAIGAACAGLGGHVREHELKVGKHAEAQDSELDDELDHALEQTSTVDVLAIDAAGLFAAATAHAHGAGAADPARAALRACVDTSWNVTRAVAARAFLAGGRGGRIVYVAPASDAGQLADAARAGLENLARTLSIEWARHSTTAVAIVSATAGPRAGEEVAALTAYLASPAGAYFSGCLLDLRGSGADA